MLGSYFDSLPLLRMELFFFLIMLLMLLERLMPRRAIEVRKERWTANFSVFACNALVIILMPISALAASLSVVQFKVGLLPMLDWSLWTKVLLSMLLLDLVIYWQHRLFHQWSWGWKIHRMHHTDTEIDVTTALRFHPIEIAISIFIKVGFILLIGAPVLAVLLFEVILNGSAMFNHSNIKLFRPLDQVLRLFIVTPDMHRVHHSVDSAEHNTNYGFCLSIWDRIFGSYTAQPKLPHEEMKIGLDIFQDASEMRLKKMLTQAFRTS